MITTNELRRIADEQMANLEHKHVGLTRDKYRHVNQKSSQVKIISGIRRCGKSTLLHQIQKNSRNSFYLNFENPGLSGFTVNDFSRLDQLIKETRARHLFFDEIQNVEEWERYIRTKHDEGFDMYLTGSNASMLSAELGTKLTGRYQLTELFPFSYKEFLAFRKIKPCLSSTELYMKQGGFPEYLKEEDSEYLYRVYYDVLFRDVAIRHKIRQTESLKELAMFLISNTGKRLSYTRIKNTFGFGSTNTVIDYISFFSDSYLFFLLPKFDYSVRKQLINDKKIYAIDTGMCTVNSASLSEDKGRLLENMVFLHLRQQSRNLYYFAGKFECDFVVRIKTDDYHLVQVCLELNSDNLEREMDGLLEAMKYVKSKKGLIVTLDQSDAFEKDGKEIRVLPYHEFVLTYSL